MKIKDKLLSISKTMEEKSLKQFGFRIKDATFEKVVSYMYERKDSSSLAVTRILFGLAMVFDIPDERGGSTMDKRWSNPKTCHFPLIPWIQALPMPFMVIIYAALWIGAFGIMLGYKYRICGPMFTICYWYLFLIEKSYWNNHSYLFGLVALLLSCTEANCYWSLDVYFKITPKKTTVPYWNYFLLKYQFFILYFVAGMKKGSSEWLSGYSVRNLSEHWVFNPFKLFLTVAQTDYLIVHWFIFVFDLTIAVWMIWSRTRNVAMVFCALFHLMNSILFTIGMFPWVCLATMPLFYPFDWPHVIINHLVKYYRNRNYFTFRIRNYFRKSDYEVQNYIVNNESIDAKEGTEKGDDNSVGKVIATDSQGITQNVTVAREKEEENDSCLRSDNAEILDTNLSQENKCEFKKRTVYLVMVYIFIQAFLPFSHFITQGYNNWTNGLYGYSWDMMVHTWDIQSVVVKIVDNDNNTEHFVDPYTYSPNDRWTRHSDMAHQYARCLKHNLLAESNNRDFSSIKFISENISIYIDVWCSLNGRFVQRVFDPNVDMLKVYWSPFRRSAYLMPLLSDAVSWRTVLDSIREDVHSWSNQSDVVFFADFPGYYQEKYIHNELYNVSVTILEGQLAFEPEISKDNNRQSLQLKTGDYVKVETALFHKILNIGNKPAFYMYTFNNSTEGIVDDFNTKTKLKIFNELYKRLRGMVMFVNLILQNVIGIMFYCIGCQI